MTGALAGLIALVLTTGIVAAVEGTGQEHRDAPSPRTALRPTQTGAAVTVDADVKATIPLPTTTTRAPASTTTSTTAAPRRPTSTSTSTTLAAPPTTLSTIPPSVPSTIVVPPSWSNQSGGTALEVRITPEEPKAGQAVTFVFEYSSDFPCCDLLVDFGDGSGFSDDASVTCPEVPPRQPGNRRLQKTHTYAKAGVYTISVSAVAHSRCELVVPAFHAARVSGAIAIT